MPDYINANNNKNIIKITSVAILIAFVAIILGAYTRLTNAGLGCPDWPGCYGKIIVAAESVSSNSDLTKAWTEMIHRYIAGSLGCLIIILAFISIKNNTKNITSLILPFLLVVVLIFQALLGMWTVTLKLLPTVVMGHLIGGFVTISLLVLLLMSNLKFNLTHQVDRKSKIIYFIALLLVFSQILLGGWTSSNYSALACTDFPTCNGQWLPEPNTLMAMNPFLSIGPNYEGGLMDNALRITIQLFHRWGALIVSVFILLTIISLRKNQIKYNRRLANWLLFLIISQIILGIINVKLGLPIISAILHNAVACLLLLTLVSINYRENLKRIAKRTH